MIRSATYRLLQHSSASFGGLRLPTPFIRFSAEASSTPPPPQDPVTPTLQETPVHSKVGDDGADHKKRNPKTNLGGGYGEEQARVLRAALSHVPKLGWSESAMISGARDVGVSPSIVGSFPRREAALVENIELNGEEEFMYPPIVGIKALLLLLYFFGSSYCISTMKTGNIGVIF